MYPFRARPAMMVASLGMAVLPGPPRTDHDSPRPEWRGAAAVLHLDDALPAVAHAAGMTARELRNEFLDDPTLFLATDNALGYSEPAANGGDTVAPALAVTSTTSTPSTPTALLGVPIVDTVAPASPEQLFSLASKPGATRTIYIDATGHRTEGTRWNAYSNFAPIDSKPFDLGGDGSVWDGDELALLWKVWRVVAEDFAPFDVNVTTQDPGVAALQKSSDTDDAYGIRVVVSPTNWYDSTRSGVAFYNSFTWPTDTPVFCFTPQLAKSAKPIGDCISHEAGHSFGLRHDGVGTTQEYYTGTGGWAPIMGNSYSRPLAQWSQGEYPGANNTEDDLAIIGTTLPYRADEYSDDSTGAISLSGGVLVYGLISTRTDVDVFQVVYDGPGTLAASATPHHSEGNLVPQVTLTNAAGQVLDTASAAGAATATASAAVVAGTYFITVDGAGVGSPATGGYSDYASIGEYELRVTATGNVVNPAPIAVAAANLMAGNAPLRVSFDGGGSSDPNGEALSYAWDFGNGSSATTATAVAVYDRPGNYTATVTVRDSTGLRVHDSVVIRVSAPGNTPAHPTFIMSPATQLVAPQTIAFTSTATDDDGTVTSHTWDFGNGTTSTLATPSVTYKTAGTYTLRYSVTDDTGQVSSVSQEIHVATNQPPIAAAAVSPVSGVAPQRVTYSSLGSQDPEGRTLRYSWVFNDGTTSALANPSRYYTSAGTYTATLTVRDPEGARATATVTVVLGTNQPPIAVANAVTAAGTKATLVRFSSLGSTDPEGGTLRYAWRFGNGSTSVSANPSTMYSTAGTYHATLTVRDANGATASTTVTVVIAPRVVITIGSVALTKTKPRSAVARVRVVTAAGVAVAGAQVTVAWGGVLARSVTAVTGATGYAVFRSGLVRSGTITATVTNVTDKRGYVWDGVTKRATLLL